jgi:acyl carrier protein
MHGGIRCSRTERLVEHAARLRTERLRAVEKAPGERVSGAAARTRHGYPQDCRPLTTKPTNAEILAPAAWSAVGRPARGHSDASMMAHRAAGENAQDGTSTTWGEQGAMNDGEVFEAVRDAVIVAKAEVVALAPGQVTASSLLAEPPICLDSLESIAMISHLEETLGLVAEDEHFFSGTVRTVADVVAAVQGWLAGAQTAQP